MKTRYIESLENDSTPSRHIVEKCRAAISQDYWYDDLALVTYRGTREEYELALEYCRSLDPLDRRVGAEILAQIGWGDQTFLEESVDVLIPMLKDPDVGVILSAAMALGHRSDPRAIPYLIKISNHDDSGVRYGAAYGLLGQEDPAAIKALIRLSKDSGDETRNWVLFGLGQLIETDTPEIRAALFEGLQDTDADARDGAIFGLAIRGDARVVDAILNEWQAEDKISRLSIEAAGAIGDPRLLSDLQGFLETMELDDDSVYREYLVDAIASCQIKTK